MKSSYSKLSSQFLLAALLATGSSIGFMNSQSSTIHADVASDSLEVTDTQEVDFVDQQTGKTVGHQQLTLASNGKTFAEDTKLKLPDGYKRTDKFVYDLAEKGGKDKHYSDNDGKVVWNVYVAKDTTDNDDVTVKGKAGRQITTKTTTSDDGSTVVVTTTITTKGNKSTTKPVTDDSST